MITRVTSESLDLLIKELESSLEQRAQPPGPQTSTGPDLLGKGLHGRR